MNRKQLLVLLALVLVVGGAGLLLRKKEDSSWTSGNVGIGKKLMANLPINDISHVVIKQGAAELNLEKKDDLWRVRERDGYPANYTELADFLLKVRDLKAAQTETVGPSQLPRLGLSTQGTNAATVVEFRDKSDKTLQSLLLGKKHMKKSDRPSPFGDAGEDGWPDGRYIKVGNDATTVVVISDPMASIEPKPEQWLSKDFFHVDRVKSISVSFSVETNSWKLSRETESGEWKLADTRPGELLDSAKTASVANPLSSPSFVDVINGAKPEMLGLDKPTLATLETFDDFTYTLKVGGKTNDNYPLMIQVAGSVAKERTPGKDEKPEDKAKLDKEFKDKQAKLEEKLAQEKTLEKWTYLVSSWTLDALLKERSHFMVEKKDETKKDDKKGEADAAVPGADATTPPAPATSDPK